MREDIGLEILPELQQIFTYILKAAIKTLKLNVKFLFFNLLTTVNFAKFLRTSLFTECLLTTGIFHMLLTHYLRELKNF